MRPLYLLEEYPGASLRFLHHDSSVAYLEDLLELSSLRERVQLRLPYLGHLYLHIAQMERSNKIYFCYLYVLMRESHSWPFIELLIL